jgi:hypothetical protein
VALLTPRTSPYTTHHPTYSTITYPKSIALVVSTPTPYSVATTVTTPTLLSPNLVDLSELTKAACLQVVGGGERVRSSQSHRHGLLAGWQAAGVSLETFAQLVN